MKIYTLPIATVIIALGAVARADDASPKDNDPAAILAEKIDGRIAERWEKDGVKPAPLADDAEFLRRVWLDLAGTLPPPTTVREFLADARPDKRQRVIDELLDGSGYVTHFAAFWRDVLIPEAANDGELQSLLPAFDLWLQRHLARETPFDQIVREILTTPLEAPAPLNRPAGELPVPSAIPFFVAKETSPENLAAAASRAFLGVRVECAQCHDHPFDRWSQREFWGFASFFGGLQRQGGGRLAPVREVFDRREMMIPETETVVQATYLDGSLPVWRPREGARQALARWIVAPENPYFAQATANRLWGYLLGHGLVDPVDDFSKYNPPSHPELLEELAQSFADEGFDLKFLLRAITTSRTYQRTSRQTDSTQEDARQFARASLRGLSPLQTRRALLQATGVDANVNDLVLLAGADRSTPSEQELGVLGALAMMNGPSTAQATSSDGPVLSAVLNIPLTTDERLDALYLATLSRYPTSDERQRLGAFVEAGGADGRDQALADVFWVLINSSEFLVNH